MSALTKELKVRITADANGLKGALNGICNDINIEGCLSQIDSTTCIECKSNYILNKGKCIKQEGERNWAHNTPHICVSL